MHVYINIYIYQLPKLCCTKLRKKIFQGTTKEACPLCFLRLSGMASTSEGFLPLGGSKLYRHDGFQYEILSTWMIWGNINFRKPQVMLINMDYNIILTSYYNYIILTIWKLSILYLERWCNNHHEKYESRLGWWHSQYMGKKNVPNHRPDIILYHISDYGL